jgi:hypothetical protein
MNSSEIIPSSFRDPSGFLFTKDGQLFRQINECYRPNYQLLIASGLYQKLVAEGLLIPHIDLFEKLVARQSPEGWKIIQPQKLDFISYPYEWCFSQLKIAAQLTLKIQKIALGFGMSLKDASAYNIQFYKGLPILIDTLSFEKFQEGLPWNAYRQFCQHFLAPLALMSYCDVRLGQLLRLFIDGIPLDLASRLLPSRTRWRFSILSHLHLHARLQKKFSGQTINLKQKRGLSNFQLLAIVDSLQSAIQGLSWEPVGTEWADYYDETNYSKTAFAEKKKLVAEFLKEIKPTNVWDLGANQGVFSRIAAELKIPTIAFDSDPAAVENNFRLVQKNHEKNLLPLLMDFTNPSPSLGWASGERMSFLERGPGDAVLALALVHHLAISNNLPFKKIAEFFSHLGQHLIVEFVPKNDSQVKRLLVVREDIFEKYSEEEFEKEFSRYFIIRKKIPLMDSGRILYLMKKNNFV